jgi:hypothetical protein
MSNTFIPLSQLKVWRSVAHEVANERWTRPIADRRVECLRSPAVPHRLTEPHFPSLLLSTPLYALVSYRLQTSSISKMWLIDTRRLKLKYITNPEDYKYAILSHTWGDDEVTFEEIKNLSVAGRKTGYEKIRRTCERASKQGLSWAWVDTCCIDKSSSAELSESINSMFQWYRLAAVCYAWLEDWDGATPESMRNSRWFTRGWTLQELIAPSYVEFLDHDWVFCGNKVSLGNIISAVTRVDSDVLQGLRPLSKVPVGRRMSWAAFRQTTRVEDRAYSLLGLFDINMPLLYGEGQKAFLRLQEEIARNSSDMSLFAWDIPYQLGSQEFFGMFAPSPDNFKNCGTLIAQSNQFYNLNDFVITNKGLNILTSLVLCQVLTSRTAFGLPLWCHREEQPGYTLAVPLSKMASGYTRSHYGILGSLRSPFLSLSTLSTEAFDPYIDSPHTTEPKQILISKAISRSASIKIEEDSSLFLSIKLGGAWENSPDISAAGFPPALWDADRTGFHLAGCTEFVGIVVIALHFSPTFFCELQIVCGYCKEVGGCWACIVPKSDSEYRGLSPWENGCAYVISTVRKFNDEACANSWHGYEILRHFIFSDSKDRSGVEPTKTNMRVDGRFDWHGIGEGDDARPEFQVEAHLKCTENTNIEGANGEISANLNDL